MVTRGSSTTTLSELIFVENEASQIGGGIDGKRITAEKLKFSRNNSPKGGAISVEDSYLHLKHCLFRDNNSSSQGELPEFIIEFLSFQFSLLWKPSERWRCFLF